MTGKCVKFHNIPIRQLLRAIINAKSCLRLVTNKVGLCINQADYSNFSIKNKLVFVFRYTNIKSIFVYKDTLGFEIVLIS